MAEHGHKQTPEGTSDPTYQDRDIQLGVIAVSLIAMLLIVIVSMLGVRSLFRAYESGMYEPAAAAVAVPFETERPQGPILQVFEARDLAAHRAYEDSQLHDLSWVNHSNGVARIPIEDALRIVARQGLPVRDAAGAAAPVAVAPPVAAPVVAPATAPKPPVETP